MSDKLFQIRFHHGGEFIDGISNYVWGTISLMSNVDPDKICYFEVVHAIKKLGYPVDSVLWFKDPNSYLANDLKLITDNHMLLEMFEDCRTLGRDYLDIYVQVVDIDIDVGTLFPNYSDIKQDNLDDCHELVFGETREEVGITDNILDVINGETLVELVNGENAGREDMVVDERGVDDDEYDSSDDETYMPDTESDTEEPYDFAFFAEGDRLSDTCDPLGNGEIISKFFTGDAVQSSGVPNDSVQHSDVEDTAYMIDLDTEGVQSDPEILVGHHNYDDGSSNKPCREFDPVKDMKNHNLFVGLVFPDAKNCRKAFRKFSLVKRSEIKILKSERYRFTAKCKTEGCQWRVHAGKFMDTCAVQIRSLTGEPHRCSRYGKNKSATSTYLAEAYLQLFIDDPSMSLKQFQSLVKKELRVNAELQQLYRAKRKALTTAHGDELQQYSKLRRYCRLIAGKNPGSTAVVEVEGPPVYRGPTFKKIFIMYNAQKMGFLEGCRPIIGLDACYLKSAFPGHLLAATARDGNNQMFPLAIGVADSECKESWGWFLTNLFDSLRLQDDGKMTFISDRQKGLVEVMKQLMPSSAHRFCVRHIYDNFYSNINKEKEIKNLFWAAARSYSEDGFNENMNKIKEKCLKRYGWLKRIPTEQWCKHKFTPDPKCDILSNNMAESYNSCIRKVRDQGIFTMVEALRRHITSILQEKREWIEKYNGEICPRIHVDYFNGLDSLNMKSNGAK